MNNQIPEPSPAFKGVMYGIAFGVLMFASMVSGSASANMNCGFEPFKPINCTDGYWVCQCDEDGRNCQWVLMGC